MNDNQLIRYSRHILLNEWGIEGQEKLLAARVLVVGAGGLGSPCSMYLAAAGIGKIIIADDDQVDATNLQRQILHDDSRVGWLKTASARESLVRTNPEIEIETINQRIDAITMDHWLPTVDAVVDCCDNFATRHLINRACVKHGKPLISGAAIRFDGQLSVFDTRHNEAPCYHCLFPEIHSAEEIRCATLGVFAPLTGIVGTTQAAETLKVITGIGQPAIGRLLLIDALKMEWRSIRIRRDPNCSVCSQRI